VAQFVKMVGNKKTGTEGTYSVKFLIAMQTIPF